MLIYELGKFILNSIWTNQRDLRPILVTGSHRSGTTWVGKMINLSCLTYYTGEIFQPSENLLPAELLPHQFLYISPEIAKPYIEPLKQIFDLNFSWPNRRGLHRMLPSRLALLKHSRRWFGIPRPIMKDPMAIFSVEWLAETFDMDVVCLIRHPAAFVSSLVDAKWDFKFDIFLNQPRLVNEWLRPYTNQMTHPPNNFVERSALLWCIIYHVLVAYNKRHPEWEFWRLEDISQAPLAAFEQIFSRLDLPYSKRIQRKIWEYSHAKSTEEGRSYQQHAIKRNSRKAQTRWRQRLTSREIRAIRRITEPLAHQYYSDRDW